MLDSDLGKQAICVAPNLKTESSGLGMICQDVVDVKFIFTGCTKKVKKLKDQNWVKTLSIL